MLAGGDLIEDGAEGEKSVRASRSSPRPARETYRRCADGEAGAGEVGDVGVVDGGVITVPRDEFRQTEIEEFCRAAVGEKNVGGLMSR